MSNKIKSIRFLFKDHLNVDISSLQKLNPKDDLIFICEVMEDFCYIKHHKKKIAFWLSCMRNFAQELKQKNYQVLYKKLDDIDNSQFFLSELQKAIDFYQPEKIILTYPSEYYLLKSVEGWQKKISIPIEILEDNRFLCNTKRFEKWAKTRRSLTMEFFYREMRKDFNILMNGREPLGGAWNFDQANRKTYHKNIVIQEACFFEKNIITSEVLELVSQKFSDHFGDLEPFYFATTRIEALEALHHFIEHRLSDFGTYQDVMIESEPWMNHSHLSFYLNNGLLMPWDVILAVEKAYHKHNLPINSVEGFIRQIAGWREYVHGIYWLKMPQYVEENFLQAQRTLPEFYWTAKTKMNCIQQCVKETQNNAYAHHIQRLMVLGNFALLIGVHPKELNEWFWIVYADAYEWVELPNVSGMTLFADGGYLATKPYASSGAYIQKMSNYCIKCSYDVKQKRGDSACPFNYLYWNFLMTHYEKLKSNHRLNMPYKTLDKMSHEQKEIILKEAKKFIESCSNEKNTLA